MGGFKTMWWHVIFLLTVLSISDGFPSEQQQQPPPTPDRKPFTVSQLTKSLNLLGFTFYTHISGGGNALLSPISIASVLSMLSLGAKGKSKEELCAVLNFNSSKTTATNDDEFHQAFQILLDSLQGSNELPSVQIGNGAFVQKGLFLYDTFQDKLRGYYSADVYSVDFQSRNSSAGRDINEWVRLKTRGKISSVLDGPPSTITRFILLSAVYFKGLWQTKFDPESTSRATFYNDGVREVTVDMMHLEADFLYLYDQKINCHILELPYRGEETAMVVILPTERRGIPFIESKIDPEAVLKSLEGVGKRQVDVYFPKFHAQSSYDLESALRLLNLNSILGNDGGQDLSGIFNDTSVTVDGLFHKAVIDVDEDGTEAAAVSSGIISHSFPAPHVPLFFADHPFMFLIHDVRTKAILFIGRVSQL